MVHETDVTKRKITSYGVILALAGGILFANQIQEVLNPDDEDAVAEYYGYPAPRNVGDVIGALTDRGKMRITMYPDRTEFGVIGEKYKEAIIGNVACASTTELVMSTSAASLGIPGGNTYTIPASGVFSDNSQFASTVCQSGEITKQSLDNLKFLSQSA